MNAFKTVWILILATIFIGVVCWSVITLTLKSENCITAFANMLDKSVTTMETTQEVLNGTASINAQLEKWINVLLPPEACEDLRKYTKEYYETYGRDDIKYFFDTIKGEAAKRKLQGTYD